MTKDIFISYSRRDTEFVTRLASDLNAQVAGVWFDQSAIQLGQKWHDEIMDGIRECKAFILVLSPDSVESKYVREEVNKALELGKTIFPVIYRPATWKGKFRSLTQKIQTLDLRSGSYTDNYHKLVDGLIKAGAVKITRKKSYSRQSTIPPLIIIFRKIPGWAFSWGLGWLLYWLVFCFYFTIRGAIVNSFSSESIGVLMSFVFSGGIGGFTGGLIAGLFTMLALRQNAPSIQWKHMSPSIQIWGISGALGIFPALTVTINALPAFLTKVTFVAWCFLTGIVAGFLAVHHIRRLEPGITNPQGGVVCFGWGCAALVGTSVMFDLGSQLLTSMQF